MQRIDVPDVAEAVEPVRYASGLEDTSQSVGPVIAYNVEARIIARKDGMLSTLAGRSRVVAPTVWAAILAGNEGDLRTVTDASLLTELKFSLKLKS